MRRQRSVPGYNQAEWATRPHDGRSLRRRRSLRRVRPLALRPPPLATSPSTRLPLPLALHPPSSLRLPLLASPSARLPLATSPSTWLPLRPPPSRHLPLRPPPSPSRPPPGSLSSPRPPPASPFAASSLAFLSCCLGSTPSLFFFSAFPLGLYWFSFM